MGIVYRGVRIGSGEKVAVKTVRSLSPKFLSALRDEVVALKRINHPGVIQVLDEGLSDSLPWYAMELLTGMTLASFNRSLWDLEMVGLYRTQTTESRISPHDASQAGTDTSHPKAGVPPRALPEGALQNILDVYRGICRALAHVHQRGMVHRDLKPSNVFLKVASGPVLVDFGLASPSGGASGREILVSSMSTARAGSAYYMSPEQIRGDVVDARADLYSLGCMLYESLCGHPPFFQRSASDALSAQLHQPVIPLSRVTIGVPPALDALLERLLAKIPQQRMGYAEDVDTVLKDLGGRLSGDYPAERDFEMPYLYRPRLAGRSDVLTKLEGHLEKSASGQGALVLIGGESGIGKTFLATEVSRMAAAKRCTTLTGDCLPVAGHNSETHARSSGAPFQPFRRLLQYVSDRCREGGRDYADGLLGHRGKILAQYEPTLAFAPGQDRFPDPPEMVPDAARRRVFGALTEIILALSDERPLLWVLDDLQWADDLSLSFISSNLAPLVAARRLLIVATFRSDEITTGIAALVGSPLTYNINLTRLDAATISSLVADMLGIASVPNDLLVLIFAQSEGNPFFVAEYLRAAVAEMLLRRRGGRWELGPVSAKPELLSERLPLPGSIRGLIGRRIQGLAEPVRAVLAAAAVVGREAEVELVGHVLAPTGTTQSALADALEVLCRRHILEWIDASRVRFVHDTIREAAYVGIEESHRRLLHGRIAQVLELKTVWSAEQPTLFPRLANHFQSSGQADRASDYFLRAARLARAAFANDDAIRFYRAAAFNLGQALKSAPASKPHRTLLIFAFEELGEMLALTGAYEPATIAYNDGLALCSSDESLMRARLHRRLGKVYTGQNQHAMALQSYLAAENLLNIQPDNSLPETWHEWVEIQTEKVWGFYWTGDTLALDAAISGLAPVVERYGTSAQRANFYQAFCLSDLRRHRYRVSSNTLALIRSAAQDAAGTATPAESASVRFIYAFALMFFERLEAAHAEMQEVVQAANRLGDPLLKVRALAYLSLICRQRRNVERTRQLSLETIDLAAAQGAQHYLGTGQANLGWAFYASGKRTEAERWLRAALSSWASAPTIYPFQDLANWPLVALLVDNERTDEAFELVQSLNEPTQRRFGANIDAALSSLLSSQSSDTRGRLKALRGLLANAKRASLH